MHWYLDPITNHYTDFSGRASRQQYWMFVLFNLLVSIGVGIVSEIVLDSDILATVYSLAVLLPSLAIGARRLHDTGRSAWWLLLIFVPIVGWIALLIFYVLKGDEGSNAYGAPVGAASVAEPVSEVPAAAEGDFTPEAHTTDDPQQ